jgi:hypothetical protein
LLTIRLISVVFPQPGRPVSKILWLTICRDFGTR